MLRNPVDALLLVSYGGPEGPAEVMPFLDSVLRGRNVPTARKMEVAQRYARFGGVSPINSQTRALLNAVRLDFQAAGLRTPVFWGNRHSPPFLVDTLRTMAESGVRNCLAFFLSAFSSYSSCRQYLEAIEDARQSIGSTAPPVAKLRAYFNHPGFLEAWYCRAREAMDRLPANQPQQVRVVFTAHSLPSAMAQQCAYVSQIHEASRLVADELGLPADRWQVAYQSRSGPPSQPWLEPGLRDVMASWRDVSDVTDVVVIPIGFVSDHMEVLFDLDIEARQWAAEYGLRLTRAATVGDHPRFVTMVRHLFQERIHAVDDRPAIGNRGPAPDVCPPGCCNWRSGRP